jgi:hypothetical protein
VAALVNGLAIGPQTPRQRLRLCTLKWHILIQRSPKTGQSWQLT